MSFKILHKYLLRQLLRNVFWASGSLIVLFLIFDFFDRIDNILPKDPDFGTLFTYFIYKIPQFFVLTLPISFIIGTLFTYGILSKNSEIIAMRSAGLKLWWLALPLFLSGLVFSIINLVLSETLVPHTARRVKEIYNIDIKRKDLEGIYSQKNIWWRSGENFYSVEAFDSRDSTLHTFSNFEVADDFAISKRIDSSKVNWLNPNLGWNMEQPIQYKFFENDLENITKLQSLPLPIKEQPKDFFHRDVEPMSMSFFELKKFIKKQQEYGRASTDLLADLNAKIAFPFVVLICAIAVFPFAIRPARTGSMAGSFIAGILVCFVYYAVHSFSLALGRAELLPAFFSAWMANLILALVGFILFIGAEVPD